MGVLALLALSVALRAEPARVVLRERDRVELRIRVPGAPADATVEIWSSVGTVVNLRRESRELFRATWRAPTDRFPQVALLLATVRGGGAEQRAWLSLPLIASESLQISARAGPASGTLTIAVRAPVVESAAEAGFRLRDFAAGALVGGQSNLSRANALSAQAEVSAHPGLPAVEVLARAGFLQYAPAHSSIGGIGQRGDLNGLSLALGARASMPLRGRFPLHASLLAGALRSFGAVTAESGPAAGLRQGSAQWGVMGVAAVGASMRAGSGRAVAELQLAHAPGSGDVSGNLGGIGFSCGYLFGLR